jgi:hypothetical protein
MGTRRVGISAEHVNAPNLVEVDFYGHPAVQQHWKAYKEHLFTEALEDDAWLEKKEGLLANMLFEMAAALRFNIPAMEIFKGGYAPKGWLHRDSRSFEAMEFVTSFPREQSSSRSGFVASHRLQMMLLKSDPLKQ